MRSKNDCIFFPCVLRAGTATAALLDILACVHLAVLLRAGDQCHCPMRQNSRHSRYFPDKAASYGMRLGGPHLIVLRVRPGHRAMIMLSSCTRLPGTPKSLYPDQASILGRMASSLDAADHRLWQLPCVVHQVVKVKAKTRYSMV